MCYKAIKKTRVLIITSGNIGRGGVQKTLENWIKHFQNKERYSISWFCLGRVIDEEYFNELRSLGINLVVGNIVDNSIVLRLFKFFWYCLNVIGETQCDVVYINTGVLPIALISTIASKIKKIRKIIVHSHNVREKNYSKGVKKLANELIYALSDVHFACSQAAGRCFFGNNSFIVLVNYIELNDYIFNEEIRSEIRTREGVVSKRVIGTVGRLSYQKNSLFLLSIFKIIHEIDSNTVLWFVGDGELHDELLKQIQILNLEDSVKMFGDVNYVNHILQAMDVFVFPSRHEGYGIAPVEAQVSGLQVVASTAIPEEAVLSNNVHLLDLSEGSDKWAEEILRMMYHSRSPMNIQVSEALCYNIQKSICILEDELNSKNENT